MDFLYFLQEHRTEFLDNFFTILTQFGGEIITVVVLCILFWCINKKTAYKFTFIYFISGFVIQGLKIIFRIDRPWILDSRLKPVKSAVDGASGYSFPSGHTQNATSLYGSISVQLKKVWVYVAAFVLTALVMLSRMYLGCHTPKDVFVSFGVTIIVVFAANYIFERYINSARSYDIMFLVISLCSIVLIAYSAFLVFTEKSTPALTLDCFKTAGLGLGLGIGGFIEAHFIKYDSKCIKSFWGNALKLVIGLLVLIAIKQGLKYLMGDGIITNIIRHCVIALWIVAIYPLIIKKISS